VSAGFYNEMITMHGTTMIFLAGMPLLIGLMNFAMPLQIGARDVAFPFLNSLGFWLFMFGGTLLNLSFLFVGAPDSGWTSYASLELHRPGHDIDFDILWLERAGASTIIGRINIIVTNVTMRVPGMIYMRLYLFTSSTLITSGLIMFASPA